MEQAIINFMKFRFVPVGIFSARKAVWYKAVGQTIYTGMLLAFPMIVSVWKSDQIENLAGGYVGMIYVGAIGLNLLFLLLLSVMCLLLNITAVIPLRVKEFYSFFAYCSTIPALAALVIGSVFNLAFEYFIYNFSLLFLAYRVYQSGQRGGEKSVH